NFYCTQTGAVPGCTAPYPNGIPYRSYTTWNVGIGITKSVFTLDLRYYDTDLNKGDCNAFTSDNTATFTASFTPINPGGVGSKWGGGGLGLEGTVRPSAAGKPQETEKSNILGRRLPRADARSFLVSYSSFETPLADWRDNIGHDEKPVIPMSAMGLGCAKTPALAISKQLHL